MAVDISTEVTRFRNAIYGADVKEAFISCVEKIHDENTEYDGIKTEVKNAAATVKEQVSEIDTKTDTVEANIKNLNTAITNGKTQQTNLETATKNAKTQQTNLETATKNGKTQQTNTENATANAATQQKDLQSVVDSASQVNSDIQKSVSAANTAATNANNAAASANNAASAASTAASNANTAANAASTAAGSANTAAGTANLAATTATNAASAANTAAGSANTAAGSANNAAALATDRANEAREAATTIRDDCYPMMFREYDGRTYSVFFADADETMVSTGTKEDDNADIATPTPSTDEVRNANPYDDIPLFKPIECNGYVDADGEAHITAVKGEPEFRTDGSKGDVCIALKTGYIRTIVDTVGVMGPLGKKGKKISVTDSWRESEYPGFPFIPYTAAIRPDNTVRPYVMIPKYQAINATVDGITSYYSLPGAAPVYNVSHNNQITTFRKRGTQYCGETNSDAEIWETLFEIVFATMNSQSIMAGCTNYSFQYAPSITEENVERYILTNAQAANVVVGSCVSIGETAGNTSLDRYYAWMHNLADRKIVTKKEALDDGANTAIYVDNGGETFTTTSTCRLSSMPWYTGSTDTVKGTCGSPGNNTNGKYPFKFLGIEFALGQYVVRSDVILNGVYDSEADTYKQEIYACYDCANFATSVTANYTKVGYDIPDSGNAWKYIKNLGYDVNFPHVRMASEYGADSSKRYADGCHTGGRAAGTRGFLSLGNLYSGSFAGLRFANLDSSLGTGHWFFSARPSFTGRRGTVVDWAKAMGVNLAA
jgi:hypothetical protein